MRFVISAAESILPVLRRGSLVVLESTSPARTTVDLIAPILERGGLKAGVDFSWHIPLNGYCPGRSYKELVENARVIGGLTSDSARAGKDLYSIFVKGEIIETDATTAEMVKLMENTYRDINIGIANEFSHLADHFGVDVWEAIAIANRHPRVKILNPGPGVGGHCISVDPWFLVEAAPQWSPLVRMAREVNDSQPEYVVKWMERKNGSIAGKKVLALGLSYKPDVDDFRESPAVEVVKLLQEASAEVKAFDPYANPSHLPELTLVDDLEFEIPTTDIIIALVAHQQFKQIDPVLLARFQSQFDLF